MGNEDKTAVRKETYTTYITVRGRRVGTVYTYRGNKWVKQNRS